MDGWNETEEYEIVDQNFSTSVTVVVAAYNEEDNIRSCVQSILDNNYPQHLLEVIIVDNGSTDSTLQVIQQIKHPRLTILQQSTGHKKESLELAFSIAKGDLIMCTDADCIVSRNWIGSMCFHHEVHQADFVLGPIVIGSYKNLPQRFQAFDMLAMMGITAGGVKNKTTYQANGANMAFAKSFYDSIDGIPRKDVASGDDVFLLHRYVSDQYGSVYFNRSKDAIVKTLAISTWEDLIQQRIRWASKATSYVSSKDRNMSAFIFIFCVSILINFILTPFTGGVSFFFALFQLFIKGVIDYAFIDKVNKFFLQKRLMKYFLSSFIVHFLYILFAGFTGLLKINYRWKDKKIKV